VKKGRYLDFNISVSNDGLMGVDDLVLTISSGGEDFDEVSFGTLGVGYKKTLQVINMKLPSRSVEVIDFRLDASESIKELDKKNNVLHMSV